MTNKTNSEKPTKQYSLMAKIFHWGFVILFLYGIYKQVGEIEDLSDTALLRFETIFASVFLIVLIARFAYMKITQTSSLPVETSALQKRAAKWVHYGMYISLAFIAGTGLLIGYLYRQGLQSGFLIETVVWIHEASVSASFLLIAVHVIAALYHRFLNDGVWGSMVPFWRDKS